MYMLHATVVQGTILSGNAAITKLQEALIGLAKVTGNAKINPGGPIGGTSGVVDDATIGAVGASAALLEKYAPDDIPSHVWTVLRNAKEILDLTGRYGSYMPPSIQSTLNEIRAGAVSGIEATAPYLEKAIRAATLAITITGGGVNPMTAWREQYGPSRTATGQQAYTEQAYAPGTVAAYDKGIAAYRIAIPIALAAELKAKYGTAFAKYSDYFSGEDTTALSEKYVEIATAKSVDTGKGIVIISLDELEARLWRPWYKRWTTWAIIAGALGATGAGWWWFRRRKG